MKLDKDKFKIQGIDINHVDDPIDIPNISYTDSVIIKLKSNKAAICVLIIFIVVLAVVYIGPKVSRYGYNTTNVMLRNTAPSKLHIFGTDEYGRDIFTRVCVAVKVSLLIGIIVAAFNVIIGTTYGAICVYYGGLVDDIIMRIVEIVANIPNLLLIVLLSLFLQPGIITIIASMCIIGWCNVTRIIRGQLLPIKEQEYILASEALGAEASRIIVKHMLINAIPTIIVTFSLEIPNVILNESILSYIGMGVQPPNLSIGTIARDYIGMSMFHPYQMILPSLVIIILLISLNVLGDCLRDALDPRIL
ncbi:ABC transporter permease [Clostridium sp. JN-9]|uniref:ABC transporter permease n=1 Tax=Clostridium sp. JN-9 TaxID=2507159 RepID=UPI000FFE22D6|nr:ABC transporter permease [Clostridium sp. JN-9]QAT39403.1 ABC transporter permease [Clostridium sp. JN-9]